MIILIPATYPFQQITRSCTLRGLIRQIQEHDT